MKNRNKCTNESKAFESVRANRNVNPVTGVQVKEKII